MPAQLLQLPHETPRTPVDAQDVTVKKHQIVALVVHLFARERVGVLHAETVADGPQRRLALACGDVRQQRQVLDEAALLALGCVRRAQHAPLRRLQRAWASDLHGLANLRPHLHHGAHRAHIGEARQYLRAASSVDSESLDVPVPGGDRMLHGVPEPRSPVGHHFVHVGIFAGVALASSQLAQCEIHLVLDVHIEGLELILEEQLDELAR
mmetsp:Transcript_69081/g.195815  ORF Transcript_69081/g.195815 Transcript_69081/m.195815 type:complete len:210 (-) Transcript_69081:862-1491(-)